MVRDEPYASTIVPVQARQLKPGMLRTIVRQAGMSVEEFVSLFMKHRIA
jgi:predicted RNA binding protein YcfA (HicA-like mRNA interferase family)